MPDCKRCGNYTKYNNGLCYKCYKSNGLNKNSDDLKLNYILEKINDHIEEHSFLWSDNSNWYVGVTNNPKRRKSEHESKYNIKYFKSWNAKSVDIALKIEQECGYKKAGMWGGGKAGNISKNSTFVYVYKH
tara:strand:+ start:1036 stop:1428 length:393 start_codon:yes stop_codon:yes gene_type:complete